MNRPLVSLALAFCLTGTAACAHLGAKTADRQTFDPRACQTGTFDVYFRPAQVKLSAQAKAQIEDVRRAMSGCRIKQISVVALPDATDDARTALKVSQARAQAIVATLGSSGVLHDKLHVLARGDTAHGDGRDLMQRRALVTVQASAS